EERRREGRGVRQGPLAGAAGRPSEGRVTPRASSPPHRRHPMSTSLHRRALTAALAAALAAPALAGASRAVAGVTRVELADAFLLLRDYLALKPEQRDRFHLAYRAVRRGKPAPDVKAQIIHRDH